MSRQGVATNKWAESEWAQRYLRDRGQIPHRMEGYGVLLELLPAEIDRVLDLGTGDGYTLGLVLGAVASARGIGLDFNQEMVARFHERFEGDARAEIVEHNLDDPLPASLGAFDVVVSSFAIHHCMPERQRALYGEVFQVLRPGGLFANLEHVDSATVTLHHEFLATVGIAPEDDDPSNKLVAPETQLAWLRDIGFEHVDCFWRWRELALLAGRKPG